MATEWGAEGGIMPLSPLSNPQVNDGQSTDPAQYQPPADPTLAAGNSAAGLPSSSQIQSTAPAPLQAFGALPTVNPTYTQAASMNPVYSQAATGNAASMNAATVDPTQNDAYLKQYEQLLNTTMQPQFQSQNQNLQDSLAARGISSSGSAAYLQNQLAGQQASALASATSPLVQQGYGYTQSDIAANQSNQQAANSANSGYAQQANLFNAGNQQQTNLANQQAGMTAGSTNAGYGQQANLANQAAGNSATATNAGYYNEALTGNANAYNSYLQSLQNQGNTLSNMELSAYLNSYGPNTGVTSAYNTGLAGTQGAYNSVYGNATGAQSSALGTLGTAAGTFFG